MDGVEHFGWSDPTSTREEMAAWIAADLKLKEGQKIVEWATVAMIELEPGNPIGALVIRKSSCHYTILVPMAQALLQSIDEHTHGNDDGED